MCSQNILKSWWRLKKESKSTIKVNESYWIFILNIYLGEVLKTKSFWTMTYSDDRDQGTLSPGGPDGGCSGSGDSERLVVSFAKFEKLMKLSCKYSKTLDLLTVVANTSSGRKSHIVQPTLVHSTQNSNKLIHILHLHILSPYLRWISRSSDHYFVWDHHGNFCLQRNCGPASCLLRVFEVQDRIGIRSINYAYLCFSCIHTCEDIFVLRYFSAFKLLFAILLRNPMKDTAKVIRTRPLVFKKLSILF